ncbi:MAG: adenosylmethionine decarboxylase [Myxococcales bacterium]|nr:adenosylmethionine decarboxylase [Myxococcales bacterium]
MTGLRLVGQHPVAHEGGIHVPTSDPWGMLPAVDGALGRHRLCELRGCAERALLDDAPRLAASLRDSVRAAGATVVAEVVHAFSPHGVTAVLVLAESHVALHSWPEHRFAAVDLFTCGGTVDPWCAFDRLGRALGARETSVVEVRRGLRLQPPERDGDR